MLKSRNLLCLLMLSAAMLGPGTAVAADEPTTSSSVPGTTDTTSTSSDTAPLTLDQEQIDALTNQVNETSDDQSVFEKASDFVTDNAPWFIIGIIVLAAIIAGILIMRGRPRKGAAGGTPRASKSTKAMRDAGGVSSTTEPAQVPSASELRRRKRAAIQRSREEERMRRKAGIEGRKASRRGQAPPAAPVAAAAAGAAAVTAAGAAAGSVDPVEAEKQAARDQATAAGAMARLGDSGQAPAQPRPGTGRTVPAPVSPTQTAPAAGVVTPEQQIPAEPVVETAAPADPYVAAPAEPVAAEPAAPRPVVEPAGFGTAGATEPDTVYEPAPAAPVEAETNIMHEPALEAPGPDAAVGNAAQEFLAAGAAGAAGGLAAARAGQQPAPPAEPVEPAIAPEPGMAPEYAVSEAEPIAHAEPRDPAAAAADERLRAKVAEIQASQAPPAQAPFPPIEPAPGPTGAETGYSTDLTEVERKLSAGNEERDRALRSAEERLRLIEQRAEVAERRAAFAERLANLKVEESEREKRLNDVVSGIDRAEKRAREAEARAEAAERAAAAALEQGDSGLHEPEAPATEPRPAFPATPEPVAPPRVEPPAPPAPAPEPAPVQAQPAPAAQPPAAAPETPERRGLFGGSAAGGSPEGTSDSVNLNSATFEQLRETGLSVTQATRILAYRERFGGYSSVEDLEKVPGFPADLIESLKSRITV